MTYFVLLDLLSFFTVSFGMEEECAYDYFFQYLADCEGNNNSSLSMYVWKCNLIFITREQGECFVWKNNCSFFLD